MRSKRIPNLGSVPASYVERMLVCVKRTAMSAASETLLPLITAPTSAEENMSPEPWYVPSTRGAMWN